MTKVLITGGAGFIGSHLAEWIVDNISDAEVICVDDLSGGYKQNIPKFATFLRCNLTHIDGGIKKIVRRNRPDVIYHLGAYAAEGLSPFIRGYNYTNNVVASANVIGAAIEYKIPHLVFTSSIAVYGDSHLCPFSEMSPTSPKDPYGLAKLTVEKDLEIARQQHGLNYTILRPYNVVGPRQNIWDKYRNVFGIWCYKILSGGQPLIYGDGTQRRSFTNVRSIVEPMWKAFANTEAHNQVINLGSHLPITLKTAYELLQNVAETDVMPEYVDPRFESLDCWADNSKAKRLLDFQERPGDLANAVEELWLWARLNWDQRKPKMFNQSLEINEGLYSYWK